MLFILATPFLLYISKKACDNMFPKFMSEIYLKIGVFLFRIYFMCYVFIQNVRKNKLFKRSNVKSIMFIKNGKTMFEHNLDDIILKPSMFNDYDLILYKTLNNTSSNYKYEYNILRLDDKRHLYSTESELDELSREISDIKFLNISVSYNDKNYNIDFGENNYYIVGNILLDKTFIQWYIFNNFKILIEDDYTCNVMDNNVNIIELTEDKHIIVEKDNYNLI